MHYHQIFEPWSCSYHHLHMDDMIAFTQSTRKFKFPFLWRDFVFIRIPQVTFWFKERRGNLSEGNELCLP